MNTTKLEELIDNSDLNQLQKDITRGFISRAKEYEYNYSKDRELIEKIYSNKIYFTIVISTEEVKIFQLLNPKDKWDIKYPFRSIYLDKDNNWRRVVKVSPSVDAAYLCYLENKYLNSGSGFADFALKMLEMRYE